MTSALLVIDVQNGVVDGMPGRDELIATIGRLVESARDAGRLVVWVQHRSAFGDTGLGALLREYDVERLVLVGA